MRWLAWMNLGRPAFRVPGWAFQPEFEWNTDSSPRLVEDERYFEEQEKFSEALKNASKK